MDTESRIKRPRIVVVETEPLLHRLLVRELGECFHVDIVDDDPAALSLVADRDDVVAVVTGLRRTEGSNGLAFLAEVRTRAPALVRIVLSGTAEAGPVVEAIERGDVHGFVAKPWLPGELVATVAAWLERQAHDASGF